jgi:hypothetical protein
VLTRGAQVRRNDNGSMGGLDPDGMDPDGHLKFYKDNVVIYGTVTRDIQVNCPINGSRRYANFMCNADGNFDDSDLDGDLTFEMTVDRKPNENPLGMALDAQEGFWTDGWLNAPNEIQSKLDESGNRLHDIELIMYGRPAGKPFPGGNCDGNVKPLFPRAPACSANVRICPNPGRGGGGLRRRWCGRAGPRGCAGSRRP